MKILCVIDSLGPGGAQRQMVELALGFKERGAEVSFLVYHDINFYKEVIAKNELTVTAIVESSHAKRLLKMRRFIRQGGFTAVLAFLEATNFIAEISALPWRRWKLVVGERSANPNILKLSIFRFYRLFHLLATYVVANSQENIKIVRRINPLLNPRKFKVIYNIVDFKRFSPGHDPHRREKHIFKLLVPSSLRAVKNLDGLIEAVNMLSPFEKDQLRVEWYGISLDNTFEDDLRKINAYNLTAIFSFYLPTPDIHLKMRCVDAVGLFSFYEGLPNAICEGMASGKLVFSSAVSDVPKLLNHDKRFLFDPHNPLEIKNTLSTALSLSSDEIYTIGQQNRERAMLLFDRNKIISEYFKLLQ